MGASGFGTGTRKFGWWYKNYDTENWLVLADDSIKLSLDESAIAQVIIKEYNENPYSHTNEYANRALNQAVMDVLANHGPELYKIYVKYENQYRNQ